MKFINLRLLTLFAFALVLFTACKKVEVAKPIGDRGQTVIKLMTSSEDNSGLNYNIVNIDLKNSSQNIAVLEIRRDVPNEVELNKTLTVTLKEDSAYLKTYAIANAVTYVALPANIYTVDPASATKTGDTYSVTFQPGEFSKKIRIILPNASTLDVTNQYAFAFTILAASAGDGQRVSFSNRSAVVEIGPKNQFDGIYKITGQALRAGDPVLSGPFGPYERVLATSGANSVQWQGSIPWANGGNSSLPAGYEPNITIDPVTFKITSLTSPGGIYITNPPVLTWVKQEYDPATKTMTFEFSYGAGPSSRLFSFKAEYVRPR